MSRKKVVPFHAPTVFKERFQITKMPDGKYRLLDSRLLPMTHYLRSASGIIEFDLQQVAVDFCDCYPYSCE